MTASTSIPLPYRNSVKTQAEVLINILEEMDGLSIEMIGYTNEKRYEQDHLRRSDAILDRYLLLFEIFDEKKEQLYTDIRRIHESYPNAIPTSSWYTGGQALLRIMDENRAVFFGIKKYSQGKTDQLPETAMLETDSRKLVADEYQNLKGLQRYGRNNGLCPYSPYEDLAENSLRFAKMPAGTKVSYKGFGAHPFESFFYFYNNALVYEYNKFAELSKAGALKMINQPDLFVFTKTNGRNEPEKLQTTTQVVTESTTVEKNGPGKSQKPTAQKPSEPPVAASPMQRDTVYVERLRVDTVYVDRGSVNNASERSLDGFAVNNMVLLLDVSSSMNSPMKMPLLKRSIKSLLSILRPEDQISIVIYSGKARVVLKPTSGSKAAEISRMIDLLQSDGDTDGNEGIRLAYKTANKNYIRGGNNRIVLATDGEFPVSDEVFRMIGENARQDVYLTVFTFGKNAHNGQKLRRLSESGKGTYAHVTEESADLQLILEAQGKKLVKK